MELTQARLQELLRYDPDTGIFTWRVSRHNAARAGAIAGSVTKPLGYVSIRLDNKPYLAHRLAFLYMTGKWPERHVDHKFGNPSDNRWLHIRDATPMQNLQNRTLKPRGRSGLIGAMAHGNRWRARIKVNGVSRDVGVFRTPEEAHEAYMAAKRSLHEFFVRENQPEETHHD